jgi:hypothetical protein
VGPGAGLGFLTKRKFFARSGFRNPSRPACILVRIATKLPAERLLPPSDSKVKVSGAQAAHPNLQGERYAVFMMPLFEKLGAFQIFCKYVLCYSA